MMLNIKDIPSIDSDKLSFLEEKDGFNFLLINLYIYTPKLKPTYEKIYLSVDNTIVVYYYNICSE